MTEQVREYEDTQCAFSVIKAEFFPAAPERITGVAIMDDDGRLWSLPAPARHGTIYALAAFMRESAEGPLSGQGFTTNTGRFVGREEAVGIATDARQLIRKTDPPDQLFSEDVW